MDAFAFALVFLWWLQAVKDAVTHVVQLHHNALDLPIYALNNKILVNGDVQQII